MTASGTWQSWSARAVDCRGMPRRDRANGNERQGNFSLRRIFHAGAHSCGLQGARLGTGDAAAHDLLSAFAATLRG